MFFFVETKSKLLKETQHTKFKPKFNEDVIETLVAFANTEDYS